MKRFVAVALVFALAACGGDATSPTAGATGTWDLKTINGASLPVNLGSSGGVAVTALGSVLTMSANGSYNEIVSLRLVGPTGTATTSSTEVGTWNANGSAITFHDQTDQSTYQGSVSGNTLTEIVDGFTQVYARR